MYRQRYKIHYTDKCEKLIFETFSSIIEHMIKAHMDLEKHIFRHKKLKQKLDTVCGLHESSISITHINAIGITILRFALPNIQPFLPILIIFISISGTRDWRTRTSGTGFHIY